MAERVGRRSLMAALGCVLVLSLVGGCAPAPDTSAGLNDPLEPINRATFEFNMAVHRTLVRPAVDLYTGVMPDPAEKGVRNFFRNVGYVHVVANDLLQGQFERAWQDTNRLAINTTIGVVGVFDPAAEMGLPYRRQNFGVTAAKWGLPPGPYIVLPVIGPHTLRSAPDIPMRLVTNPIFYIDLGATQVVLSGVGAVDSVASEEQNLERIDEAVNPYVFVRRGYLERQRQLIRGEEAETPFEPLPPEMISSARGSPGGGEPGMPPAGVGSSFVATE